MLHYVWELVRRTTLTAALLVVLIGSDASMVHSQIVFGTESGYDSGGIDPVCWLSQFSPNISGVVPNDIESMNVGLQKSPQSVTLMPSCFNGTRFAVLPLDLGADRVLITEQNYTFRLNLEVNLTAISTNVTAEILDGKSRVFFRLLMCDAIREGFCDPLRDLQGARIDQENSSDVTQPVQQGGEEEDDNRFEYIQGDALQAVGKGQLIFTRWIQWTLRELEPGDEMYRTAVNITIQLPSATRVGAYFFIGHAVMSFPSGGSELYERIDVADAVPDNVVQIENPQVITKVSFAMIIALSVIIGICSTIAFLMLLFVLYHLNHTVIRLAQGPFLAALVVTCLVNIIFTFTALPTRSIFCTLRQPMVILPSTLMACILVGRMWRVYTTLSTALGFGGGRMKSINDTNSEDSLSKAIVRLLGLLASVAFCCSSRPDSSGRNTLRRTVSARETTSLIVMLFLPQLLLQVVSLFVYSADIETQFELSGDSAREVCDGENRGRWVSLIGLCYTAGMHILAVFIAWVARELPSAFNEKDQIFSSAIVCTIITFLCITMLEIADDPATPPDIEVFLRALLTIGCSMAVLIIVVFPKMKRVLSGEKVILTNVLAARYDRSSSNRASATHSPSSRRPTVFLAKEPVKLQKDDAMPPEMETYVLDLQTLLRSVSDQNGQGRPLRASQWKKLQVNVAKLKMELDRIDLSLLEQENDGCSDLPRDTNEESGTD
ncbi:predicted protein [Phaeodactylum tricornutum CCAP 1055/1]|uniref:G-protein coupled receptors family 3 profile domain-containing protein n=3 Tax=Phaeodactylum tricornutum TaxID=2850 RepID=B7G2C0_PHATC|nr:predicted protein [Phaeodactylum tricornutum CCAP 1055/1]EEC47275.1 predicted protein [Phaeodactylum tricornutum CCAP 1055/1]|eukprot:XP_002181352.1 predicted protein [Phaeodactylum tricornutum CCAP 1055/1]